MSRKRKKTSGRLADMPSKLRTINGISEHNGVYRTEIYEFRLRLPKGRTDYDCAACGEDILKGTMHVYYVTRGVEAPGWEYWRIHGECYLGCGVMFEAERPDWRWAAEDPAHE